MHAITMTNDEIAIYDDGTEEAQVALMRQLRERAVAIYPGMPVEIYTADGLSPTCTDDSR